jgi:hypothetical protein
MSAQMRELEGSIAGGREQAATLFEEGQTHLAAMRALVSAPGEIEPRSDQFGQEAVKLAGVIAALERTSVAPSVARAATDLSAGFIAPVASGRDADLAGRQDTVMATVRESVGQQSAALATAAAEIMALPKVAERRYVPMTSAEAVLRYAGDFIPSWAGAISIDLLPAVLVGIMAIVYGAMRRGEDEMDEADLVSAADMARALRLSGVIAAAAAREEAQKQAEARPAAAPAVQPAPAASDKNVTPLPLPGGKRFDS